MKVDMLKGNTYVSLRKHGEIVNQKVPLPGIRLRLRIESEEEKLDLLKQLRRPDCRELYLPYLKEVREVTIND